jgi:hypothetical protein
VKRFAESTLLVVTLLAALAFILTVTGLVLEGLQIVAGESPAELTILRGGLIATGMYVVARFAYAGHKRLRGSADQDQRESK